MEENQKKRQILLVEDDYALAMGTEYSLTSEGYEVTVVTNASFVWEKVHKNLSLILLDVMLPDGSGYEVCKQLRARGFEMPIIFLTAVGEEANVVQGLDMGADDYITKPFRVKELLSRIAANIRRYETTNKKEGLQSILFGACELEADNFRLLQNGIPVECTVSEFRLLRELVLNRNQVMTRSQLMERLWDVDEAFVDDNTLSVYIKRLRDKLGKDASFIRTVRGVGYCFWMDEEA